jgi:hypothetical protein
MSHFYGVLNGSKGQATRCGTKNSGMITTCASWSGAVVCTAYVNLNYQDCVKVELTPWRGHGINRLLYDGVINPEVKP